MILEKIQNKTTSSVMVGKYSLFDYLPVVQLLGSIETNIWLSKSPFSTCFKNSFIGTKMAKVLIINTLFH
jgi:hypothetical protein